MIFFLTLTENKLIVVSIVWQTEVNRAVETQGDNTVSSASLLVYF